MVVYLYHATVTVYNNIQKWKVLVKWNSATKPMLKISRLELHHVTIITIT